MLFPAAAAAAAAALALARQIVYGPGLFPDSLQYLSVAGNLQAGNGFIDGAGNAHVLYPALYPLLLAAAAGLTGIAPLDVAGPLNALIFGLTVFVAGRYAQRRTGSRMAAAWVCAAVALSLPLSEPAVWALSEPLFLLLAALALVDADEFLRGGGKRALIGAAAWGALAWQTRYIGVAAPVFIGLLLLLRRGARPGRKAREAALVWAAAGLPMGLWMLRNALVFGAFSGRWMWNCGLSETLSLLGSRLMEWADPAALALGAAAAAGWAARRAAGGGRRAEVASGAALWLGFGLTYALLLTAAIALGFNDCRVWPRYAAPLYFSLVIAGALGAAGGGRRRSGAVAGALRAAVAAAACFWLAGRVLPNAGHIAGKNSGALRSALDYNAPYWAESETLAWLRENPLDGVVYTNGTIALLYLHNAGEAAYRDLEVNMDRRYRFAPDDGRPAERSEEPGSAGQDGLEAELAAAPEGAWLVWFKQPAADNAVGYGAPWLRVSPSLEVAAELADGGVYGRAAHGGRGSRVAGRAVLRTAVAGRGTGGGFDVSWRGGELVYVREGCTAAEARMRFFLHVHARDAADLPAERREYGFDNLDFFFTEYGAVSDGACRVVRPLPEYAIERIETGQYGAAPDGAAGIRGWGLEVREEGRANGRD